MTAGRSEPAPVVRHPHRHLVIRQGDRELWAGRPGGVLEPNRSGWVPSRWIDQLETARARRADRPG